MRTGFRLRGGLGDSMTRSILNYQGEIGNRRRSIDATETHVVVLRYLEYLCHRLDGALKLYLQLLVPLLRCATVLFALSLVAVMPALLFPLVPAPLYVHMSCPPRFILFNSKDPPICTRSAIWRRYVFAVYRQSAPAPAAQRARMLSTIRKCILWLPTSWT